MVDPGPDVLGLAAGWTFPVAAAGLVVALAAWGRGRCRVPRSDIAWSAVLVAVPVLAAAVLSYVPSLLLAVVAAAAGSVLHLLAAVRDRSAWGARADRTGAVGWGIVAGVLATYHPVPALVVASGWAGVATIAGLLGARHLLAAAPVLVAAAMASCCWLMGWPLEPAALAVIVATCAHALVVGTVARGAGRVAGLVRLRLYVVALGTSAFSALLGASGDSATAADWLVGYLIVAGCAAGAVAVLERSREAAWVGAALQVGATWVRLVDADVRTVEAYSLPLAAILLALGAWTLWRDPRVGSVRALTPGLTAALAPTLVIVADEPVSLRALLLALACGVTLVVAVTWRLRAPLLAGAGTGAVLALLELVPYHDAVPRWLTLGVAGLLLLVAGVRWEQLASLGRLGWDRVALLR